MRRLIYILLCLALALPAAAPVLAGPRPLAKMAAMGGCCQGAASGGRAMEAMPCHCGPNSPCRMASGETWQQPDAVGPQPTPKPLAQAGLLLPVQNDGPVLAKAAAFRSALAPRARAPVYLELACLLI